MTEMRDARLKKALDSAPDVDARPGDAVRQAILDKARLSAAAAAYKPRRSSWWSGLSRPWNSGLATVGLVAFVGVLIWGQGLLKQAPLPPSAIPQASVPMEERKASSPGPAIELRERDAAMKRERAAQSERKQDEDSARKKSAAREATVEVSIAPLPNPPMLEIVEPPAVMAPAPAAPAMMSAPPPAPPPPPMLAAARAPAFAAPNWTALRILTPEGPVVLARESLPPSTQVLLQQQMRVASADAASASGALLADKPKPAPGLQVELLNGEISVVHLDIAPGELRQQLEQALSH